MRWDIEALIASLVVNLELRISNHECYTYILNETGIGEIGTLPK